MENKIGFPLRRVEITDKTLKSYDETFSFKLCQKFYGKREELRPLTEKITSLLLKLIKNGDNKLIAYCFSLLGNMYYILGDFKKSIGCFLKSLSYNKNDLTNWIELIFALRAEGKFEIFEDIIFNLEKIYISWKNDLDSKLTKEKIYELINKVKD